MAFNFIEIKKLGVLYRTIEKAMEMFPNQSLQKTQDLIGSQILAKTQSDSQCFQIPVECRIREFPRPKYAIGQYVEFRDDPQSDSIDGIIIGLAYQRYEEHPHWWYELEVDLDNDPTFAREDGIIRTLTHWRESDIPTLDEESQAELDNFLRHFEESHGPLLPIEIEEEDFAA